MFLENNEKFKKCLDVGVLFFCPFIVLLLVAVEVSTINAFITAGEAKSWPQVTGTIVHSEIKKHWALRGSTSYNLNVQYEYIIDGKKYHKANYDSSLWEERINSIAERFPMGSAVPVYYNLSNPHESYLIVGVGPENYILIFAPLVGIILFTSGFMTVYRRRGKKRGRESLISWKPSPPRGQHK